MPEKKRSKRTGFYVELPDELLEEYRRFCDRYPIGNVTQHTIWAIRRHMASPPIVCAEPLPKDAGMPPVAAKRGAPPKKPKT